MAGIGFLAPPTTRSLTIDSSSVSRYSMSLCPASYQGAHTDSQTDTNFENINKIF